MRLLNANIARQVSLSDTFAALRHPNYRLWFTGQLISLLGSWMQTTAQGYLIYELTQSPAYLGYVGFVSGVPAWLFTLYGGIIADRLPRRTLLMLTQSAMMSLAFLQATLVFTGLIQPWHILVLATMLGVANAFDAPARQAFVVELVEDRRDMTNAIALNSTMFNSATFVGPAVAGIIYDLFGPAWCFTVNGVSFLGVLGALALMKLGPFTAVHHASAAVELKEGVKFVLNHSLVRVLILNMGMLSLFGMSMMTLVPAWAVEILGGDERTTGLLYSARGLGALVGALMLASIGQRKIRGKLWTAGNIVMPLLILAFAATDQLPLSLLLLTGIGWSFMVQANNSNAIIQTLIPDGLRGRVMSIFTLTFLGGSPLGALITGTLASSVNEPFALLTGAAILLVFAGLIFLRVPAVRKVE